MMAMLFIRCEREQRTERQYRREKQSILCESGRAVSRCQQNQGFTLVGWEVIVVSSQDTWSFETGLEIPADPSFATTASHIP
jgi:hypothetical protein